MPVITPAHQALWLKADPLTLPATDDRPITYGAEFRPLRAKKRKPVKTEAVDVEEDGPVELLVNE